MRRWTNNGLTRSASVCIALLVVFWAFLRFYGLEKSPPGFYIDESSTALNVICLGQRGESFFGDKFPLFPRNLSGGRNSPTFTYFGALWTHFFGYSISSFRGIAALCGSLSLLGMFFFCRVLWGTNCALLCALTLALSPWAFQSSRIAWDACVPLGLIPWALYFLFRQGLWSRVAAGILFSLSMYSYGASRIQVPLLLVVLVAHPFFRRRIGWNGLLFFGTSLFVASIPLLIYTIWGDGLARFHQVGIVSHGRGSYLITLIKNLALHFNPFFLFWKGDMNLRHSTYFFGQLGWLDILALFLGLMLVLRRTKFGEDTSATLTLVLAGIFAGILPAALTWDSLPHALRSSGSAPFFAILSGWLLWKALDYRKALIPLVLGVALFYTGAFMESYFVEYPRVAGGFFDSHIRNSLSELAQERPWMEFLDKNKFYHEAGLRYFLASNWGIECKETLKKIEEQKEEERAYAALRKGVGSRE